LINATKEFTAGKPQNTLSQENIKKIISTYDKFKEIKKLSKIITLEETEEADFNLSPSRYVSVMDEEEYRPIGEIVRDLEEINKERQKVEENINKILEKAR